MDNADGDRTIQLEPSWKQRLQHCFEAPQMQALRSFLVDEKRAGKRIYPAGRNIFAAFDHTPFDRVKVVILGQDPYHGPGQAHGLCFSVQPQVPVPPSLKNIFKEIHDDLGLAPPDHGCLIPWAERGVLLLNTVLTVEHGRAASHRGKGWEGFTDAAIHALSEDRDDLVFLLWGSHAGSKAPLIDARRHTILRAPHPSPLSAHRGFFGCAHFSRANDHLRHCGRDPIDWSLPCRTELESG